MSETLIIDLKELETKVEKGKGFNHKEATVLLEFVRKIIGNGGTVPQAQPTIPKSIADEFDQIYEDTEEYQKNVARMFSSMQPYFVLESYPEILHWLEDDVKNTNVVLAYLAGKALGVDLVKVVADE